MRNTTRKKYYGRSAATGALSSAINSLQAAIEEAGKPQPHPPLYDALKSVAADIGRSADLFDVYNLKRKRLQKQLRGELVRLEKMLQEVQSVPVTQEEKLLAKRAKK